MHQNMPMCPYAHQMMPNMPMMEMDKTMPMMPMHYMMPMMMPMQHMMPMHYMMPMLPMLMEMDDEDDDERYPDGAKAEEILQKIEKNDLQVFAVLRAYGIPMPVARRIVRRIIRLTLMYSR